MFSPATVFALGITLITLSTSIIASYMLTPMAEINSRQRGLLAFGLATMTFYVIRSSLLLQQVFSYLALVLVILFPVIVGYIGFRELVLQGVYNQ